MGLYSFIDYREALSSLFEERQKQNPELRFSNLARETGIQATYVTNVLKGRASFSADQLYLFAKYLELKDEELRYLQLLLEWDRSALPKRRTELKAQIETVRREHLRAKDHLAVTDNTPSDLQSAKYYLDPYHQIVHICLTIPAYAKDTGKLATRLGISSERMDRVVAFLLGAGYLERKQDGTLAVLKDGLHLPEDSPLHLPHQAMMRNQSLDRVRKLGAKECTFASATFTANEEVRTKIHLDFLRFFKNCQKLVSELEPKSTDTAYQLNFDLFRWD